MFPAPSIHRCARTLLIRPRLYPVCRHYDTTEVPQFSHFLLGERYSKVHIDADDDIKIETNTDRWTGNIDTITYKLMLSSTSTVKLTPTQVVANPQARSSSSCNSTSAAIAPRIMRRRYVVIQITGVVLSVLVGFGTPWLRRNRMWLGSRALSHLGQGTNVPSVRERVRRRRGFGSSCA